MGLVREGKRGPDLLLCFHQQQGILSISCFDLFSAVDLQHTDLKNILDYIYQGEVQTHQQDLIIFLEIAERLKMN